MCLMISFCILAQREHYFVVAAEVVQEFAKVGYSSSYSSEAGETYGYIFCHT